MEYVIDFLIASVIYLSITLAFYFSQKHIKSKRNILFATLLVLGFISLIFDILCAVFDENMNIPKWILYLINIIFLGCVQLSGPVFLHYTFAINGSYGSLNKKLKLAFLTPYLIILILLIISPFTRLGIFYIDEANDYGYGATHIALYINMALYFIASGIIILCYRHRIQAKKVIAIYSFLGITIVSMIFQVVFPYILLNSMGSAMALIIMYLTLELPDEHVDSLTRLLDKISLPIIIQNLQEEKIDFNLIFFEMDSFYQVNQNHGIKIGDEVMVQFAMYLSRKYFDKYVLRVAGDVYLVIDTNNEKITIDDLHRIKKTTPHRFKIQNEIIDLNIFINGISSQEFNSTKTLLNTIDYVITEHEIGKNSDLCLVDVKKYIEHEKIEKALNNALDNGNVQVYYQPLHDQNGKLVALEALCRIKDEELGFLNPEVFIRIAEVNGRIYELGDIVLQKVCEFIKKYQVADWHLHHIGVNLSFLQCARSDLDEKIIKIINKYEIDKSIINFEITETQSSSYLPIVNLNMQKLISNGYQFLLDDFGSGYANYNYLFELPFHCIKIDKYILWDAMQSERELLYLKTLINSLTKLGFTTVCEGVETKEQVDLLKEYGITMYQGYFYSKALDEKEINEYYKRGENHV